jgi:hypothetical protein
MRALLLLFFISISQLSYAQTGIIRGVVSDRLSSETLPGATILLSDSSNSGVSSDSNGSFRFESIPYGRYSIQISFIGYFPITISNIDVIPGRDAIIKIELEESTTNLEEVNIVANNEKTKALNTMSAVSSQTFSVEESMRFAGARNDVARMATNYAGVSAANDANNDIVIRGNSPNGLLFRLEGADIPNPNHFGQVGATGGPVSILNNNVLANSDFITSAFPSNYGNALSGVFDLNMRSGNSEKFSFLGQIGFNGLEFGAEGPISRKKGSSFLIYYRYSTLGLFHAIGIDFGTGSSIPQYQDLSFKVDLPTKKAGNFSIFTVLGSSYVEFKNSEITEKDDDLYSQNLQDIKSGTKNANIGLNHRILLSKKTLLKTTVWWSLLETTNDVDSFDVDIREPFDFYAGKLANLYLGINTYINHKFTSHLLLQGGIEVINKGFNFQDSVYYAPTNRYNTITDDKGSTVSIQPYITLQWKPGVKWKINMGLHANILSLSSQSSIEPRLGINYLLNESNSFSAGYGLHSQSAPIHLYFSKSRLDNDEYIAPNMGIDFVKSHHFVLGYSHRFSSIMQFKTEVYYQALYDVLVDFYSSSYSSINTGSSFSVAPDTLVNKGIGRNTGIEFTLEKFMNKGRYFMFTASFYDAKYTGSDGIERDNAFNGNYTLNALGGQEIELNKKRPRESRKKIYYVILDAKATFAGGNRYTPVDIDQSQMEGRQVYDDDMAFSKQFDPYFRLDIRAGIKILGEKTTQEMVLDIQNVTNNKNPYSANYNVQTGEEYFTYQLGLFPVFQFRIYF